MIQSILYSQGLLPFSDSTNVKNSGKISGAELKILPDSSQSSEILIKYFRPVPFAVSASLLVSAGAYMHIKTSEKWWKVSDRFHTSAVTGSELIFGGAGHFFSVNLTGHLFSGVYESSGMQALESTWYSSLSALAYSIYLETENGFHQGKGFSKVNAAGSLLGTAFYIGQYYYPVLKKFQPRISYNSSESGKLIPDDIYGQKLWVSVRVCELMPGPAGKFWPDFLNAAAGIGIVRQGGKESISTYIALDLDAEKIPLHGPFWQFVKNTLNYFHFPMPGIRVSPEAAAFIFCF
ncbi:MAG: hypothetical protein ACM3Q2_00855 [Syntrophothermus sp.]